MAAGSQFRLARLSERDGSFQDHRATCRMTNIGAQSRLTANAPIAVNANYDILCGWEAADDANFDWHRFRGGVLLLGSSSKRAFSKRSALAMQWWLDGQVTWTAPRRVALAFIPALSLFMLASFGVLLANVKPRPGQDGMVVPSYIALGLIFLGAQIFHLWMISKTVQRNGS